MTKEHESDYNVPMTAVQLCPIIRYMLCSLCVKSSGGIIHEWMVSILLIVHFTPPVLEGVEEPYSLWEERLPQFVRVAGQRLCIW